MAGMQSECMMKSTNGKKHSMDQLLSEFVFACELPNDCGIAFSCLFPMALTKLFVSTPYMVSTHSHKTLS